MIWCRWRVVFQPPPDLDLFMPLFERIGQGRQSKHTDHFKDQSYRNRQQLGRDLKEILVAAVSRQLHIRDSLTLQNIARQYGTSWNYKDGEVGMNCMKHIVIGIFKAGKWELVNLVKHNACACCKVIQALHMFISKAEQCMIHHTSIYIGHREILTLKRRHHQDLFPAPASTSSFSKSSWQPGKTQKHIHLRHDIIISNLNLYNHV